MTKAANNWLIYTKRLSLCVASKQQKTVEWKETSIRKHTKHTNTELSYTTWGTITKLLYVIDYGIKQQQK